MGPPQPSCNSTLRPPKPKNITHIQFDTMYAHPNPNPRAIPNPNRRPIPNPNLTRYAASARESEIKFFVVDVPREVYFFKVRVRVRIRVRVRGGGRAHERLLLQG